MPVTRSQAKRTLDQHDQQPPQPTKLKPKAPSAKPKKQKQLQQIAHVPVLPSPTVPLDPKRLFSTPASSPFSLPSKPSSIRKQLHNAGIGKSTTAFGGSIGSPLPSSPAPSKTPNIKTSNLSKIKNANAKNENQSGTPSKLATKQTQFQALGEGPLSSLSFSDVNARSLLNVEHQVAGDRAVPVVHAKLTSLQSNTPTRLISGSHVQKSSIQPLPIAISQSKHESHSSAKEPKSTSPGLAKIKAPRSFFIAPRSGIKCPKPEPIATPKPSFVTPLSEALGIGLNSSVINADIKVAHQRYIFAKAFGHDGSWEKSSLSLLTNSGNDIREQLKGIHVHFQNLLNELEIGDEDIAVDSSLEKENIPNQTFCIFPKSLELQNGVGVVANIDGSAGTGNPLSEKHFGNKLTTDAPILKEHKLKQLKLTDNIQAFDQKLENKKLMMIHIPDDTNGKHDAKSPSGTSNYKMENDPVVIAYPNPSTKSQNKDIPKSEKKIMETVENLKPIVLASASANTNLLTTTAQIPANPLVQLEVETLHKPQPQTLLDLVSDKTFSVLSVTPNIPKHNETKTSAPKENVHKVESTQKDENVQGNAGSVTFCLSPNVPDYEEQMHSSIHSNHGCNDSSVVHTYDITVYEELTEDNEHRVNKKNALWASNSHCINFQLYKKAGGSTAKIFRSPSKQKLYPGAVPPKRR